MFLDSFSDMVIGKGWWVILGYLLYDRLDVDFVIFYFNIVIKFFNY